MNQNRIKFSEVIQTKNRFINTLMFICDDLVDISDDDVDNIVFDTPSRFKHKHVILPHQKELSDFLYEIDHITDNHDINVLLKYIKEYCELYKILVDNPIFSTTMSPVSVSEESDNDRQIISVSPCYNINIKITIDKAISNLNTKSVLDDFLEDDSDVSFVKISMIDVFVDKNRTDVLTIHFVAGEEPSLDTLDEKLLFAQMYNYIYNALVKAFYRTIQWNGLRGISNYDPDDCLVSAIDVKDLLENGIWVRRRK